MSGRPKDLSGVFDEAESRETCVVPANQSERRLLRRHLSADALVEPLPGLFARRICWDGLTLNQRALWAIRGLAIAHPSWVFCGPSAALVHGLRVPYALSKTICVANGRAKDNGSTSGAGLERDQSLRLKTSCIPSERLDRLRTERVQGVLVTTLIDTILDCLLWLPLEQALVIADSFLRETNFPPASLQAMLEERRRGCTGIARARITARFADGRAESGGESYARARMIELGYVIPDLQVTFRSPIGGTDIRPDFLWSLDDGTTIAGELDGFIKVEDPSITHGASAERILMRQNLRDNRLGLCVDRFFHFSIDEASNDATFASILDAYGVPKVGTREQERRLPAEKSRRRRGLRGTTVQLGNWTVQCYMIDR